MAGRITFYGHSAFRIETRNGAVIWIDPWLENPSSPGKVEEEPDLVLITHAHGDHLGNAVELSRSPKTEVVAIHEIQQHLLAQGLPNVTGMNIGGTYRTRGLGITMVPAVHSSSIQEGRRLVYGGEAAGFVIALEDGLPIYHAGDTALFGDMALIGEMYRPEIAILPIGDHYVMGPKEAARAAKLVAARTVIPMHYGSFPVLTGTVEAFLKALEAEAPEVEVKALAPGESLEL